MPKRPHPAPRLQTPVSLTILCLTLTPTSTTPATAAQKAVESSVVKIVTYSNPPDLLSPWQKAGVEQSGGSGVIIGGNRILTNAHVVDDAVSIEVAKNADELGYQGRFDRLLPVVREIFDVRAMARGTIAPYWTSLSSEQQDAWVELFTRFHTSAVADEHRSYSGQSFVNLGERRDERDLVIVSVRLDHPGRNVNLRTDYRLRPSARQLKLESYSELPFENDHFHRILSLETLEHVASPFGFLRELRRVARAGAKMVLSCPPATSELPYRVYTRLFGGHGEGPHRFLGSAEVKRMLAATGWRLLHHEGTLLLPVGPRPIRRIAEWTIQRFQGSFVSELGIRQFYVCD